MEDVKGRNVDLMDTNKPFPLSTVNPCTLGSSLSSTRWTSSDPTADNISHITTSQARPLPPSSFTNPAPGGDGWEPSLRDPALAARWMPWTFFKCLSNTE